VQLHPVVYQTIHATPLDGLSAVLYVLLFIASLVLTAYRARYGVALLILCSAFALYRDIGETTLTLSKIALLGTAAALVFRRRAWLSLLEPPARILILFGLLLAAATALSIWHASFVHPAVRETLKAFEYVLLFATVYAAYRLDPDEGIVRTSFCVVVAVVSVAALAQEFLGAPSGLLINHHAVPRIAGPLEGPNQLAGYLNLALPLLFAFSVNRSRVLLAVLGIAFCAELLTFSRAGIAAALVGLAVVYFNSPRAALRPALRALGIGSIAGVVTMAFWGAIAQSLGIFRLWNFSDLNYAGGVGTRAQLWRAAISLWRAHPFFGIGAGNFELEIRNVGPSNVRTHANSLYLQALVELGVPGFLATLALVWRSIAAFASARASSALILGTFAGSIALAVHQLVDLLIFYPKVGGLWWLMLGLASAEMARLGNRSPEQVPAP